MIGADGLFLTKISESEGFLELRELRSNGAIRRHYNTQNTKKGMEFNINGRNNHYNGIFVRNAKILHKLLDVRYHGACSSGCKRWFETGTETCSLCYGPAWT